VYKKRILLQQKYRKIYQKINSNKVVKPTFFLQIDLQQKSPTNSQKTIDYYNNKNPYVCKIVWSGQEKIKFLQIELLQKSLTIFTKIRRRLIHLIIRNKKSNKKSWLFITEHQNPIKQ
jgi:hypothetical protein